MATGPQFAWHEITLDPLLEAGYDGREVLSEGRRARIVRATALRQAGVRVSAPRGRTHLQGALGAEFLPDQSGQLLVMALVSSSEPPQQHEVAIPGLPRALARRVLEAALATEEVEALGSGVLRFDRALLYPGHSTLELFEWLASAVVKLLIAGLELLPDEELAALLDVSYQAPSASPQPEKPAPPAVKGEAAWLSSRLLARLEAQHDAEASQADAPEPDTPPLDRDELQRAIEALEEAGAAASEDVALAAEPWEEEAAAQEEALPQEEPLLPAENPLPLEGEPALLEEEPATEAEAELAEDFWRPAGQFDADFVPGQPMTEEQLPDFSEELDFSSSGELEVLAVKEPPEESAGRVFELPDWLKATAVFAEQPPAEVEEAVELPQMAETPSEPHQPEAESAPPPESQPAAEPPPEPDDDAGADSDGGLWRGALEQERYHFPPPARARRREGDSEMQYLCAACGRYAALMVGPGLYRCSRCEAVIQYRVDAPESATDA